MAVRMAPVRSLRDVVWVAGYRLLLNRIRMAKNSGRKGRHIEFGPGDRRIPGFETLNILPGRHVDYLIDATRKLPFADNTFELIYASHILEHVPWYHTVDVLRDWVRVLAPGGQLEIWVPNGLKICTAWVEAENGVSERFREDGWYRFNDDQDPCVWAAGRIFTYGDGTGDRRSPNWHFGIFSERYLAKLFEKAGLVDIRPLDRAEVRGYDHGWINLGMTGKKPS